MKARSAATARSPSAAELALRAEIASADADFLVARAAECARWGLALEARELRHRARDQRVAGLLLMGRAAVAN
jgi:predicted TIM-barrel fold metal-dependent hydrolase